MAQKTIVRLTANFERNLESTAAFLAEANAQHACDALLDALLDTVVPNLERFPDIGRLFIVQKLQIHSMGITEHHLPATAVNILDTEITNCLLGMPD